ncbi:hypothetical protein [Cupriavidus sp. Marseille-Q8015]
MTGVVFFLLCKAEALPDPCLTQETTIMLSAHEIAALLILDAPTSHAYLNPGDITALASRKLIEHDESGSAIGHMRIQITPAGRKMLRAFHGDTPAQPRA